MAMLDLLMPLILPLISFIITLLLTPQIIEKSHGRGFLGVDVHKIDKPQIPSSGGLALFFGFVGTLTFAGLFDLNQTVMLAILLSGTLGALIGLIDDIFVLSKKLLVLLTLAMGLPIISFQVGSTIIYGTPMGPVDLGLTFWLFVPFIFAFLTNSVNIYAGFNGLEAGCGLITSTSLAISALLYGSIESAAALLALSGALLAFLRWNRCPSKIFPGNSGTYLLGAVLAASIISGVIKMAGVIACFPYFLNFVLRLKDKFLWTVGETTPTGLVYSDRISSLWSLFIYDKPRRETTVVLSCMLIQLMFGLASIVFSYYNNITL